MATKNVLAFDFGASSGRSILGSFDGSKITLTETHRFSNDPVIVNGTFYWDILRLMYDIKKGILNTVNAGYSFESIGIDTWGVDFGLLDKNGDLLENPIHYRDNRTAKTDELADKLIGNEKIYKETGIQFMILNTLNQLIALKTKRPEVLERADKFLFMPDLMAYFLTGKMSTEYSIASTSQIFNPNTGDWSYEILKDIGIDKNIFTNILDAGQKVGSLKKDICEELGVPSVSVIAVVEHDTGSAVAAIPAEKDEDFIYISCGTWSLMGAELEKPIINDECFKANVTNEGGINRTTRFLKNIIGLWLMQESRRQWDREGNNMSFKDIDAHTINALPLKCFINPSDDLFLAPGNMPKRIREYCQNSGQETPDTVGEIARCITESLAMEYRYTLETMEKLLDKKYDTIHIIGGGVKDKLLCQFTANVTGIPVIAGPIEATALGNIGVQFMSLGVIKDINEMRKVIKDSSSLDRYEPQDTELWQKAYERFLKVTCRN